MDSATYILKRLSRDGIRHFFTVPGLHIKPLFASSGNVMSEISPIVCAHELGAGYMADGYARAKQKLGVVIIHGGPGTHNVVTAIKTTSCEKVPLLCITGDVPTNFAHRRTYHNTTNIGTQDQTLLAEITKFSGRITSSQELPFMLEQAIEIAMTQPCGPTHLIVPYDILDEDVDGSELVIERSGPTISTNQTDQEELTNQFLNILLSQRKVVLWIGETLNRPDCADNIKLIIEHFNVPVITTYSAKGVIPEDHELSFGNFGFSGDSRAQVLLESGEVDTLLALDVDWSERNTANWCSTVSEKTEVLLFNQSWTAGEKDSAKLGVCSPERLLKDTAAQLNREYDGRMRHNWISRMKTLCPKLFPPESTNKEIEPENLVRIMREVLPRETILFVDSGLSRIYAGKYWKSFKAGSFFSSTIMSATGWGIAAGIGAKLDEFRPVVILTGDGCMLMQGMEIHTAVKYRLPVTFIIMDNGGYSSMIKRLPKAAATKRGDFRFNGINWVEFANSLGAEAYRIETQEELVKKLSESLVNNTRVLSIKSPYIPHLDAGPGDQSAYNIMKERIC